MERTGRYWNAILGNSSTRKRVRLVQGARGPVTECQVYGGHSKARQCPRRLLRTVAARLAKHHKMSVKVEMM